MPLNKETETEPSYVICKQILLIFLNLSELIFWHTVKWFHLFLSNTNNFIYSFVCTQLNGLKYSYVTLKM